MTSITVPCCIRFQSSRSCPMKMLLGTYTSTTPGLDSMRMNASSFPSPFGLFSIFDTTFAASEHEQAADLSRRVNERRSLPFP
eukprot:685884-Hanusia_phi.AAC.1